MSDFQYGTDLINTQMLNMLQYIKNKHGDTARVINNYKSMIEVLMLVSPALIYKNLHEYITMAPSNTMSLIFEKKDNSLLDILNGLKGTTQEVDEVIQFIMKMWNDRLSAEEKEDVWKYVHLILKIYTRLQTLPVVEKDI